MRQVRALVALALLSFAAGCTASPIISARIEGPSGEDRLEVGVEMALTEEERALGLSDHDSLADDRGLLLRFPIEDEICIWNADVSFPIDAVFVDEEGVVAAVESDIPALDGTFRCHANTADILEVSAGVAATVTVGDQLFIEGG